ncbi:glycosyltransferase family 39 protein [Candidatus Zixiibacteriota bacterium]
MTQITAPKREKTYLALILLLGTVLRLWRLGNQSFWWDEVYSATLSAKSLGAVIPRFGQTPTLYHILLHFWLYLGQGDVWIRLLSVLFGVIGLWLIYLLGKSLLDARHGLLCAFLVAISPFHIWYSQEARMYSLLTLLSVASMVFFVKFLKEDKRGMVYGWVLTTGLAVYTHYYAAFAIVAQFLFLIFFLPRYRSRWPRILSAMGIMALFILPIVILMLFGDQLANACAVGAGGNPVQIFSFPYTFFAFSMGFSYGPSIAELHRSATFATVRPYLGQILPALLLFAILFIAGLRSLWRERERFVFLLLYMLVPIVGAVLFSMLWPQLSFNVRYASTALAAYILILARGLLAWRSKFVRWMFMALLVVFVLLSLHGHFYQDRYAKEDHRSAAEFISAYAEQGDVILTTHQIPFTYYYRGPLTVRSLFWSPKFYRQMIRWRVQGSHRVWLVMSREWGVDPEGKMQSFMQEKYATVVETTFANIYLSLYDMSISPKR